MEMQHGKQVPREEDWGTGALEEPEIDVTLTSL